MPVFGPTRAALAAAAARGAQILPSLRLVLTAEALTAPPPPCAVELNAELEVLCAAAQELAGRGGYISAPRSLRWPSGYRAGFCRAQCSPFCAGCCAAAGRVWCGWFHSRARRLSFYRAVPRGCPAICPHCCTGVGPM